MTFGARPFGTRTFGDGTGDSGFTAEAGAQISFAGTGTLLVTPPSEAAQISFDGDGEISVEAHVHVTGTKIAFEGRGQLDVLIPPSSDTKRKLVKVNQLGQPAGEIHDAEWGDVVWTVNEPDEWRAAIVRGHRKSHLVFDERFPEFQLYRGDFQLSWGPNHRPHYSNPGRIEIEGHDTSWYLHKRFMGKADRIQRLTNPGFEDGLVGWTFMHEAYWLDYVPVNYSTDVTIYEPGKVSGRACAIRTDLAPWSTPAGSIGSGTAVHTVVSGDTLWDLAEFYYGSGTEWYRIYDANQAQIQADAITAGLWNPHDPGHWIFPGQVFNIPDIPASEAQTAPEDDNTLWGVVFGYQEMLVSGGERGVLATFTGWCYVRSDEYKRPGAHERGLLLVRMPADYKTNNAFVPSGSNTWDGRRAYHSDALERSASRLDDSHLKDRWVRHEISIYIPPGHTEYLHARFEGVDGLTIWDTMSLTFDDALEFHQKDQTSEIAVGIVQHAQDPAYGNSNLQIGTNCPPSGVLRDRVYLFEEHPNVVSSLKEFASLSDGFDFRVEYTPTKRTFVTGSPATGRWRPKAGLELGRNLAWLQWHFEGESAANQAVRLGEGSGSDREEGFAEATTAYANGLTLVDISAAPPDTPAENLDASAAEQLAIVVDPEVIECETKPIISGSASRLLGYVKAGDVVPVVVNDEGFVIPGVRYRIIKMTLTPRDTLLFTLNKRDVTV